MAEKAVASKSRYRKPNEEPEVDVVPYSINDLPEAILEHILSFVPMEDAIRTSVLSKKWRYLWTSYPYLELRRWRFSGREQFTNFVDRVVLRSSSRLKRLALSCEDRVVASRVNLWASAAVKRNVEDFRVYLPCVIKENFVFPCCLFSCATLTRLVLFFPSALELPSGIWVPNLKVLHLKRVMFVDERLTEQLLSSPVLEELSIQSCIWNNLEALNIRAPMLKNLTIMENLPVPEHSCRVLICGNNLERLHLICEFLNDYRVEKSCSLLEVEANINVFPFPRTRKGEVAHRVLKVLEPICSLKKLKLSSNAVEVLSSVDELCSNLPLFPNLKLLDFDCLDLKLEAYIKLLHNAPHLEALRFRQGIRAYPIHDEDAVTLDSTPRCFSSHLRQIEVCHLFPHEALHLLRLLLKHAIVLENLILYHRWHHLGEGTEKWFQKKLLDILCGSKSLKITFVHS